MSYAIYRVRKDGLGDEYYRPIKRAGIVVAFKSKSLAKAWLILNKPKSKDSEVLRFEVRKLIKDVK